MLLSAVFVFNFYFIQEKQLLSSRLYSVILICLRFTRALNQTDVDGVRNS